VRLAFTPHGWADYRHWQTADRATLQRINRLVDDALRDPFAGIGKPEPLRHGLAAAGRGGSPRSTASSTWSAARTS
jgi:toxin YoeB